MDIRTEVEIAAGPDVVWRVLTDFGAYPQWNRVLSELRGELRIGSQLSFRLKLGGRTAGLTVRLAAVEPDRELTWIGPDVKILHPLLHGLHYFLIEPLPGGVVRLVQGERFTGLLGGVIGRLMGGDLTKAYTEFNQALKQRAERLARP